MQSSDFNKIECLIKNIVVNRLESNIIIWEKNKESHKTAEAVEEVWKIEKNINN